MKINQQGVVFFTIFLLVIGIAIWIPMNIQAQIMLAYCALVLLLIASIFFFIRPKKPDHGEHGDDNEPAANTN